MPPHPDVAAIHSFVVHAGMVVKELLSRMRIVSQPLIR